MEDSKSITDEKMNNMSAAIEYLKNLGNEEMSNLSPAMEYLKNLTDEEMNYLIPAEIEDLLIAIINENRYINNSLLKIKEWEKYINIAKSIGNYQLVNDLEKELENIKQSLRNEEIKNLTPAESEELIIDLRNHNNPEYSSIIVEIQECERIINDYKALGGSENIIELEKKLAFIKQDLYRLLFFSLDTQTQQEILLQSKKGTTEKSENVTSELNQKNK